MSILKRFHSLFPDRVQSRCHLSLRYVVLFLNMEKQIIGSDDVQQWHLQEIRAGIAEADSGQVIDHSRVKTMAASWRRRVDCDTSPDYFEGP
jgi:hypothetical protein